MLDAVIFDLDGTLIDTPGVIVQVAEQVLGAMGRTHAAHGLAFRATIGLPLPVAFAQVLRLPETDAAVLDAVERYRSLWRSDVTPRIGELVFPGVRDGLAQLRARGLRLAVATGKAQSGAEATLDAAGLRHEFAVVVGYDAVPHPKPHPDMTRHVLAWLGVEAAATVLVGDAVHDVQMAAGADVRSIACTYGAQDEETLRAAGPTWVAHDFGEVLRILAAL